MTSPSLQESSKERIQILSSTDLLYLCQIIKDRAGLNIGAEKGYLIESRLLPLVRENGLKNLGDLVQALRSGRAGLATQVINAMLPSDTSFYRDQKIYEGIKETILPSLFNRPDKSSLAVRMWSAGCSSGQEPYSLAFMVKELDLNPRAIKPEIIATDISSLLIDQAKRGIYSQLEVQRGLPIQHLVKYFKQIEGEWQIDANIRSMVKFQTFNLLDDFKNLGKFDLILCRNVLLYFDLPTKTKVLKAISQVLRPGGYLVVGLAETLLGVTDAFDVVYGLRGVYKLIT